ncbi:hypothetical protein F4806DRAFT_347872 [Annulohypoxylon nitens]|nr:hypothetical protein F4806DRAFT_347872 [Annulohypoxylon nitens]
MTYTALVHLYRKPGASPKAFQEYFEQNEIPVLKKIGGEHFPISHKRLYLKRSEDGDHEATLHRGQQGDFPYDAVVLLEFESQDHCAKFLSLTHEPEHLKTYDHPLMPDRSKSVSVILDQVYEARR